MRQNIVSERAKVGARRLRGAKRNAVRRPVASSMNTISVQRAPFEPVMRAAVDLDQFAKLRPPLAQLKHPLVTPPLRLP